MSRNQDAPGHWMTLPGSRRSARNTSEVERTPLSAKGQRTTGTLAWHESTSSCVWLALVMIGCLINLDPLSAQTSYGSVVGTVTDSAGAVLAGAHAQLTNRGDERSADGGYRIRWHLHLHQSESGRI